MSRDILRSIGVVNITEEIKEQLQANFKPEGKDR